MFVKKDEEGRIFINAIGSVWDENQVWLVTGGGALFAMHDVIYLLLKTEGAVQDKVRGWVNDTIVAFVICCATTRMARLL